MARSHAPARRCGPVLLASHRCDDCRELATKPNRAVRASSRALGPIRFSHSDFHQACQIRWRFIHRNREATLDSFSDVPGYFLHCFALGNAAGQSRNLSPVASFFCLVNDSLDLHGLTPFYYSLFGCFKIKIESLIGSRHCLPAPWMPPPRRWRASI